MQILRTFALTLVVAVVTASGFAVAHDDPKPAQPPPEANSPAMKCINGCGQEMMVCVQPCVKQNGEESETDQRCVESCRKKMERCMTSCQK